uniref:hypothetical protein n=1 Tax=Prevotella aurantiaca TaxID=596085 RepID=UPI00235628CE
LIKYCLSFQYNMAHDSSTASGYTEKLCKVTINYPINDENYILLKSSLTIFHLYQAKTTGTNTID